MTVPEEAAAVAPPSEVAAPRRARWSRVARRVGRFVALAFAAFYAVCIVLLVVYRFVVPPITGVQLERRIEAALAREGRGERQRFVPLDQMSDHVAHAVVAAEDGRFWSHWGFDLEQMGDAASGVLDGERPRGASTITQQLVKNLFGCTCRNPVRKINDLVLTLPAEVILGRKRVLELYLNTVEWGPGIFGVDAAARHFYGTSARSLSRTQAAGLAALLPNPLERTPDNTSEYRQEILDRMDYRGW